MTSTEIQEQINQKQNNLKELQEKLPTLKRERAELSLQPTNSEIRRRIKLAEQKIQEVERDIADIPLQIEVLKNRLEQAKEQEKLAAEKLVEQEALVPEMLKLSKKLVKQLQTAQATNNELKALQDQYQALRIITGQDILPMEYAAPSTGYLDTAVDVLSQELDGGRPSRHMQIQIPV